MPKPVDCVRRGPDSRSTLNSRFKFDKRSQLFIRTHNETLSVAAMRVNNEDRSPVRINRRDTAPTPTGVAEIVRDDFPEALDGLAP